jgi:hypothetical protein
MKATVEFFVPDISGNPMKKKYEVPNDPIYWPTRPASVIVMVSEVNEALIERAKEYGWEYNSRTKTFYRLD